MNKARDNLSKISTNNLMWQKALLSLCIVFIACSATRDTANMQPTERLNYAIRLFDDEKYFDAKTQFQILILNNPGSSFIDRAQFYLAECYFNMDEFITAAAEYEKLVKLYPQSDYADDAQFKIGAAYFELSPKYALDQTYTYKAIDALQLFLEEYPESDLVPLATEKLKICIRSWQKKPSRQPNFIASRDGPNQRLFIMMKS